MKAVTVAGCFMNRTILVTGSTGFLGKLMVEKILRVQPDVKRLYLLVRAADDAGAEQRVLDEVVGKELFDVLREKHGDDFHSFIKEKICPIAGDIIHENLGLESNRIGRLFQETDIIINGAATTNFYERYDVALASNTFGIAHVCHFARKCVKLKMLLHISTAYVTGEQEGLLLEQPLQMGQTLKKDCYLDIEAELELANEVKRKLVTTAFSGTINNSKQLLEKKAMKELGFKRTIDTVIAAYCEQNLSYFIGKGILDTIPGDMVVNAAMVAMATHYGDAGTQVLYHVTSALQNPLSCHLLAESMYSYMLINPRVRDEGRAIQHKRLLLFSRYAYFYAYMILLYKIPLQMLYLLNILLGGFLSEYHNKVKRSFNYWMLTARFYAPYAFFKGRFDDTNLRRLWRTMSARHGDGYLFNFDPNCFSWRVYLFNTHIPAVLKISQKKKEGRA
ncbi:hypothetical protein BS78_08G152600 [Paspalum vaginatum]|nr:hypothetical protein BS78_08G152600 [Paspalum vaginatum]KAJ1266463.1 hypothetical protein BS78_08G152600 [Paspalum vaginatum]